MHFAQHFDDAGALQTIEVADRQQSGKSFCAKPWMCLVHLRHCRWGPATGMNCIKTCGWIRRSMPGTRGGPGRGVGRALGARADELAESLPSIIGPVR